MASGFRRVLLPLDGSRVAEAVLPVVPRIASPGETTLIVLQVVPSTAMIVAPAVGMEIPPPAVLETDERMRADAAGYVADVAARLRAEGFDVEPEVRVGDPATVVLDASRQLGTDLIAMTTHGRSGVGRLVFGSVAEQVLRESRAPVFLVRMTEEDLARRAA
jgi:nucleotide-binding universal stress UspA family protein